MAIDPISTLVSGSGLAPAASSPNAGQADGAGFGNALGKLLESVEGSTADANTAIGRMLDGTGDVHEAMIAMQRADITLQMTVQVRNKLVQAYQDTMRMPV